VSSESGVANFGKNLVAYNYAMMKGQKLLIEGVEKEVVN
jgi:hypothetical protein